VAVVERFLCSAARTGQRNPDDRHRPTPSLRRLPGPHRDLSDGDELTLLSRLATESIMRMDGSDEALSAIMEAMRMGLAVGRSALQAQREVLSGAGG